MRRAARLVIRVFAGLMAACAIGFGAAAEPLAVEAAGPPAGAQRDVLRLIDLWLDAELAYGRVPGFSAGIVVGQELVWSKGYGTIDERGSVPATPRTIYRICSISKLFTSIAVMQLWESGRLHLDDDIGRWLPELALRRSDPQSGPITIESLLTHSSGLPREAPFPYWTEPDFRAPATRDELLRALAGRETMMRAAERMQYSNLGMALLGDVVEAASGTAYDEYMRSRILDPLGLADTRTEMPAALYGTRLAHGFSAADRAGRRELVKPVDAGAMRAAAGFTSTVEDLARFASWQFRLLRGGSAEVLRAATLREMQRVHWSDADGSNTQGLGFFVQREGGNTLVAHSGLCPGQVSSLVLALKDEVAVIAMSNANVGPAGIGRYARPLRQLMLKGLKLGPPAAGGPDLMAYAGRYDGRPWLAESVVVPWGEHLATLDLPNGDPAGDMDLLKHEQGDTFRRQRSDGSLAERWVFERGADGRVARVLVNDQVSERLAR